MIIHLIAPPLTHREHGFEAFTPTPTLHKKILSKLRQCFGDDCTVYLALSRGAKFYASAGLVRNAHGSFNAFSAHGASSISSAIHEGCSAQSWAVMREMLHADYELPLFSEHIATFEDQCCPRRRLGMK